MDQENSGPHTTMRVACTLTATISLRPRLHNQKVFANSQIEHTGNALIKQELNHARRIGIGKRRRVRERGTAWMVAYSKTALLQIIRSEEHTSELQSRQYLV